MIAEYYYLKDNFQLGVVNWLALTRARSSVCITEAIGVGDVQFMTIRQIVCLTSSYACASLQIMKSNENDATTPSHKALITYLEAIWSNLEWVGNCIGCIGSEWS